MTEALYLVTKTIEDGSKVINGVHSMVINKDDGQTSAQIIASAVAQLNANYPAESGSDDAFPSGYFDTVTLISDLTSGALKDDLDCYIFTPDAVVKVEGS